MSSPPGRPTLSVVMPSFQQAEYLEEAIRSVLDQDVPDVDLGVELIVMDGGSSDGSVEILRRYDARLAYWQSQPDRGQSDAINQGFARARGEVLCWLNSDDRFLLGSLEWVGRLFAEDPNLQWLVGGLQRIEADGSRIDSIHAERQPCDLASRALFKNGLRYRFNLPQPSSFFRRSLWLRGGPLDESLHYTMDRALWLRFMASGAEPRLVDRELAEFRLHGASKSVSQRSRFLRDRAKMHRRLAWRRGFRLFGNLAEARRLEVEGSLRRCDELLNEGRALPAVGWYLRALCLAPVLLRRRLYTLREIWRVWQSGARP